MRLERDRIRNLRLVEITEEEKQFLESILSKMYDLLPDVRALVNGLRKNVLQQHYLKNRKLDRTETLTQLSTWCDSYGKHKKVRPYAQEVSKLLFAGHILTRLVDKKSNKTIYGADRVLDKFIDDVMKDQEVYIYKTPMWLEFELYGKKRGEKTDLEEQEAEQELVSAPTTVSLERDLRDHIAHDPMVIENGLKLRGKEYRTDMGNIDVLCEDTEGNLVVIELKKGRSSDNVVGQILRYIGWLQKNEKRNVRGIIVLGEPDERVSFAVYAVPNIKVMYYRVHFEITEKPPEG